MLGLCAVCFPSLPLRSRVIWAQPREWGGNRRGCAWKDSGLAQELPPPLLAPKEMLLALSRAQRGRETTPDGPWLRPFLRQNESRFQTGEASWRATFAPAGAGGGSLFWKHPDLCAWA